MKKLLLVLGVLVSSVAMAEGNVAEGRLGYSFKEGKLTENVSKKVVLTGEFRKEVVPNVELGLGLDVKRADEVVAKKDAQNYDTIVRTGLPVYGVAQYNFKNDSDVVPFVKGRLGVVVGRNYEVTETLNNTASTDKDLITGNALYAGVGAGVNYKNFVADLSYNYTRGKKIEEAKLAHTIDATTKTAAVKEIGMGSGVVTLSVGYSLGF